MLLVEVIFGSICIWPSRLDFRGPSVGVALVLFFMLVFLLVVVVLVNICYEVFRLFSPENRFILSRA